MEQPDLYFAATFQRVSMLDFSLFDFLSETHERI